MSVIFVSEILLTEVRLEVSKKLHFFSPHIPYEYFYFILPKPYGSSQLPRHHKFASLSVLLIFKTFPYLNHFENLENFLTTVLRGSNYKYLKSESVSLLSFFFFSLYFQNLTNKSHWQIMNLFKLNVPKPIPPFYLE